MRQASKLDRGECMDKGIIVKISGPLVVAKDIPNAKLYDTVLVSDKELLGEIIEIRGNMSSIQVYEETSGIKMNDIVVSNYRPLSIALGPGILSRMLDGIGRNLEEYAKVTGFYLTKGVHVNTLPLDIKYDFVPYVKVEDEVTSGDLLGYVMEGTFKHYIMVPQGVSGTIKKIESGLYTIEDTVCVISSPSDIEIKMVSYWPVRKGRPYLKKQLPQEPLVTGQRVIDTFFPVAKGGTACVPGPFGSGKTVVQHQLAKWADSDVVVYIGCGERGNEMTDVLNEFPEIVNPKTNESLMSKTVLIANTSNMPVAAREASIYTGMTIAEYFRDMGYDVSLMADSTSRWAEALREMSGRLEEMPGDEGYPAYLSSRLADVYERAGITESFGKEARVGSVTMIGAVSPAGGDLSEPVTQATLKIAKVFWALDSSLAYARHFPAIHWLDSYSLYQDVIDRYIRKVYNRHFPKIRHDAIVLLKEEAKLQEIVQLIGKESLSDQDILKLEVARMIREDFLQQNAFQEEDTFTSMNKQIEMLKLIMSFYRNAKEALVIDHIYLEDILNMHVVYKISRMKYAKYDELVKIEQEIEDEFDKLGGQDERV